MAFGPFMFARFFGRRYGEAFMDYAEPVSVKSLVDLEANRIQGARDEFAAHRASLDIVGGKIHEIFTSLFRILPIHIISAALKQNGGNASQKDLENFADKIKSALIKANRNCKTITPLTPQEIITKGIASLRKLKAVKVKKDTVTISPKKSYITDYFASAIKSVDGFL
jgi:ABC-type enterochelin transport system substrate-binding protein